MKLIEPLELITPLTFEEEFSRELNVIVSCDTGTVAECKVGKTNLG